jgi:hypothetical protein
MAAATEQALAHPRDPLDAGARLALAAGAALFLGGTAAALWRCTGRAPLSRVVLVPAGAIAVFTIGRSPATAMGSLLVVLMVLAAIEHRTPSH